MAEIENFKKNRNFIKPIVDLKEVQEEQVKYIDDLKEVQETPIRNIEDSKEALIEYVAFSGGGAKGAIYSGAYAALKKADLLCKSCCRLISRCYNCSNSGIWYTS